MDFEAKAIAAYKANADKITLQDQDILNIVFSASHPGIVHFTDKRKPWTIKELNPMGVLYWNYRNEGPWKETGLARAKRRLIKAFRHFFGKKQRALDAHLAKLQ